MNKEYLYLSDKELLVIDEMGRTIKRSVESSNMHEVLLLENDLERINKTINKLQEIIKDNEENKLSLKAKVVLPFVPFVLGMVVSLPACLYSHEFLSNITYSMIGIGIMTVGIDLSVMGIAKYHKKCINGAKNELLTAYKIREDLEQKLSNIKEKSNDNITASMVIPQKKNLKINNAVTLQEYTPFYQNIMKELDESYLVGYNQKQKKLVLKK